MMALDRVTAKTFTNVASPHNAAISYTYDAGGAVANALGLLTTITRGNAAVSYGYGQRRRVIKTTYDERRSRNLLSGNGLCSANELRSHGAGNRQALSGP